MSEYVITEKQLQYYEEQVFDVSLGDIIRTRELSEHDAEIRKKERERVLDKLKSFAEDDNYCIYPEEGGCGCGCFIRMLESLRGGE